MVGGQQRVEHIPAAWATAVQRRVAAGRAFKEAVAEVLAANAQLLVLERPQRRR
jgi:predicted ABC-type transport system involved in lysophospholipase L1 biosynthesis ATPase subunit